MFRLHSEITVNNVTFKGCISVEINTSWQNLTDTCIIELPNNFQRGGKNITVGDDGFFKRGDKIEVKLGYFPNLTTEFIGYIRRIYVDNVIKIEAEDASFLLKQSTVTKSFASTTLANLMDEIITIDHEQSEANLGAFRITKATPIAVLEELKKTYGLISYIRNETLRVGLAYYADEGDELIFDLENNVVSNDLEYIDASELILTVEGTSIQKDGSVLTRYAYYSNGIIALSSDDPKQGASETLSFKSEISKSELDFYTENKLKARISTGTRGSFTAFLEPSVKHGDRVKIRSRKFPEKEGTFLVKGVVKTFGLNGGRQEITLDTQVA